MRILLGLLILLVIISCKSNKGLSSHETVTEKRSMEKRDLAMSLKKGGCFGKCPVFHLNIYNNRYVEFLGKKHTDKQGTHVRNLDKETYKELVAAFEDAKFVTMEDHYDSNIPDLPLITISYNNGNQQKTVTGKRERPETVHKLQFLLEQIVELKSGWTYVSDETGDKKEQVIDKSKIVVNIASGSQLSRWFGQMKDKYGMQILQKLSDNSDTWLVGINPTLYNPDAVLEYLNSDPVVKSATFHVTFAEN